MPKMKGYKGKMHGSKKGSYAAMPAGKVSDGSKRKGKNQKGKLVFKGKGIVK